MDSCSVKPYTGEEPYIFISYAHEDKEIVYPIMEAMRRAGYRIWYDAGISGGESWLDCIGGTIARCNVFLCFLSPRYQRSYHCDMEVKYAAAEKKTIFPVYIESAKFSSGIEMAVKSVHFLEISNPHFMDRILRSEILTDCQQENPVPDEHDVLNESLSGSCTDEIQHFDPAADHAVCVRADIAEKKHLSARTLGTLAMLFVCAVVMFVSVFDLFGNGQSEMIPVSAPQKIAITPTWMVNRDETKLLLLDEKVDLEMMQQISRLEQLEELTFRKCSFDVQVFTELLLPDSIRELNFYHCEDIRSLFFLSGLNSLELLRIDGCDLTDEALLDGIPASVKRLELNNNNGLSDMRSVSVLPDLEYLDISDTNVHSLQEITNTGLQELYFENTAVSDLDPLSDLRKLTRIDGSNTNIKDITPLTGLEQLRSICFDQCDIVEPSEAFLSLRLEEISLKNNDLISLNAFTHCTLLQQVDVSGNQIQQIGVLSKSKETLKYLDLSGNPLTSEAYHSISELRQLEELYIDDIPTKDLLDCSDLRSLKRLSAAGCGFSDISRFGWSRICTQIEYLCLADNNIKDIRPIAYYNTADVLTLDLSNNPLTSLQYVPTANYEMLFLVGGKFDAAELSGLVTGECLVIECGVELTQKLKKDAFEKYVIVNCPLDERVRIEDHFGIEAVTFVENVGQLKYYLDLNDLPNHFTKNHGFPWR